jgi:hypothetical protein
MINDIKDEPPIKLPVKYDHSFVLDADDEIVCNLLWTTHRKDWERRDEAGEHIALCINEHSQLKADLALAHERERRLNNDGRCRHCIASTALSRINKLKEKS